MLGTKEFYVHSGQVDRVCNQLTRHRKSNAEWLHDVIARSAMAERHITHVSAGSLWLGLSTTSISYKRVQREEWRH